MSPNAELTVIVHPNWLVWEKNVKTHVFNTILAVGTRNVWSRTKRTERKALHASVHRASLQMQIVSVLQVS